MDGTQLVNFEADAINAISQMDVVSAVLAHGGKVTGFGKRGAGCYFQAEIDRRKDTTGWLMAVARTSRRELRELD